MANADYIPLPPFGEHQVKLRTDSCYGDDDPTQWPQPYLAFHSHFATMPRPNTLSEHLIIWWTPHIGDYSISPGHGPVAGLGKLCQPRYNELRTSVMFLEGHATKYQQSISPEIKSPFIQPALKLIQQVLAQLHSIHMSFRHIQFVVRDLQMVWLDVWAILDYMEIYKPHIDGVALPGLSVADTIGCFMINICVAQDMFLAGLPCWLIRQSDTFNDEKIFAIREIVHPKDYTVLEPHKLNYPIIFKGPATNLEKYRLIKMFARNFLCSRDPFAMSCTPSSLAEVSQPSTSSTPAVALSSATQHSTGRDFWGAVCRPARSHGAGKFSVFDILIYYNTKSVLKVFINHPVIMGIINSS